MPWDLSKNVSTTSGNRSGSYNVYVGAVIMEEFYVEEIKTSTQEQKYESLTQNVHIIFGFKSLNGGGEHKQLVYLNQ